MWNFSSILNLSILTDCEKLQDNLDSLPNWSDKWKLRFNAQKCKVLHIASNELQYRHAIPNNDGNYVYVVI